MSKRCSSKEVGERKGGFQAAGRACAKALRQKDLGTFKAQKDRCGWGPRREGEAADPK